jgi:hypothetical protein
VQRRLAATKGAGTRLVVSDFNTTKNVYLAERSQNNEIYQEKIFEWSHRTNDCIGRIIMHAPG